MLQKSFKNNFKIDKEYNKNRDTILRYGLLAFGVEVGSSSKGICHSRS
jgi:hypothetical protein